MSSLNGDGSERVLERKKIIGWYIREANLPDDIIKIIEHNLRDFHGVMIAKEEKEEWCHSFYTRTLYLVIGKPIIYDWYRHIHKTLFVQPTLETLVPINSAAPFVNVYELNFKLHSMSSMAKPKRRDIDCEVFILGSDASKHQSHLECLLLHSVYSEHQSPLTLVKSGFLVQDPTDTVPELLNVRISNGLEGVASGFHSDVTTENEYEPLQWFQRHRIFNQMETEWFSTNRGQLRVNVALSKNESNERVLTILNSNVKLNMKPNFKYSLGIRSTICNCDRDHCRMTQGMSFQINIAYEQKRLAASRKAKKAALM